MNYQNRSSNYDKHPATSISGQIHLGWNKICDILAPLLKTNQLLALDMYVGVYETEIADALQALQPDTVIFTHDLLKTEAEILKMTASYVTEDTLFGYVTPLRLVDYFDQTLLAAAQEQLKHTEGTILVLGTGASLLAPDNATLVYADLARWEHQLRMRKGNVHAIGIDNSKEPFESQHKRCYFNDWLICDAHKESLFDRIAYWLDTHIEGSPKLIDKETFMRGIDATVNRPFRVVPFFAPAPWGGQWMKDVCDLDREIINYGWCFDCVPEENSLLFSIEGTTFELPSLNLVLLRAKALLGGPVESRFGKDFPIRFDFLDTVGGGYLSFQVHPTTHYIQKHFGMNYTQDESYYILDAQEGATVYLGLKNGVDKEQMSQDLRDAQNNVKPFDAEKYSNKIAAKKHDHFLIPAGTVHCSGPEALVLEISATPNHFTFKMWDWGRLGLDGKPRPINVERGLKVINWERDYDYTMQNLVNTIEPMATGEGWEEERTGLHNHQFIETRRHRFSKTVIHETEESVNVLNLVAGEEAIVESLDASFESFIVHYAETFIIPAHLGKYSIRPYGKSEGKECMTIKAYVRFKA
ncbi:class I mannose-6-phosphate isomerase [Sphingobacterium sp. SRCM116780]|uniref:class I mannose-6-phosphate isomerase n=1 Tax=Sphingobacterium sp. SRCM116780 TaxID=2907623 RepID=UPI001F256D10|nr:class I mannose-6-phosphate isomerase [Sphingobacterium sp. SRCM116780]UIR57689.1 class I mannose-6-phosphate isomerase [Sphingobacterium sp. SRCM116780]